MFKTFDFSILGRDITLCLSGIENNSEKKEWYRSMSLTPDEEKFDEVWKVLRKSDKSVIISVCPITEEIIIQGLIDFRKIEDDNTYLSRVSIEITDQLLETLDKGLSSNTYEVISSDGTTVLDIKTWMINKLISLIVEFLEGDDMIIDKDLDEDDIKDIAQNLEEEEDEDEVAVSESDVESSDETSVEEIEED